MVWIIAGLQAVRLADKMQISTFQFCGLLISAPFHHPQAAAVFDAIRLATRYYSGKSPWTSACTLAVWPLMAGFKTVWPAVVAL
jgi:hypothetical protein